MPINLPGGWSIGTSEDVYRQQQRQDLVSAQQEKDDTAAVMQKLAAMGGDDARIIAELPKTNRPPTGAAAELIANAVISAQARMRQRGANIFGPVQVPGSTAPGPMVPGPMVPGADQEIPFHPDRQERAGGAGPMVGPAVMPPPNMVAARGIPTFPTAAPGGPAGTVAATARGAPVPGPLVQGPDVVTPATTREAGPEEIAERVLQQAASGAGSAEILKPFQPLVGDVIRARIAEQGLNQRERLAQLANQWDLKEVQGVPVLMNKRTGELRYPSGQDQEASLIYLQKAAEAKASGEARGKAAVPSFQPATENQPAGYPEPLTRGFTALPGQAAAPMKLDLNSVRTILGAPDTYPPERVQQAQGWLATSLTEPQALNLLEQEKVSPGTWPKPIVDQAKGLAQTIQNRAVERQGAAATATQTVLDTKQRQQKAEEALMAFASADVALKKMDELIPQVLSSGMWGRIKGLTWNQGAAFLQKDPKLNQLRSYGTATLGAVSRGVMIERGVLTEGDITRARDALVAGIDDSLEVGVQKASALREFLQVSKQAWENYRVGGLQQGRAASPEERAPVTQFLDRLDAGGAAPAPAGATGAPAAEQERDPRIRRRKTPGQPVGTP